MLEKVSPQKDVEQTRLLKLIKNEEALGKPF